MATSSKYTYESCKEKAMKFEYISDFKSKYPGEYDAACRNKWLKDFDWLKKYKPKYDYEFIKSIALKYKTKSEFLYSDPKYYDFSERYGWLDTFDWFEENRKKSGYWHVYENNKAEALKYKTRKEFQNGNGSAYTAAREEGFLETYDWFEEKQKPSGYWNIYENNKKESLKYKSRTEYARKNQAAYECARINKWLDSFTWLEMSSKPNGYWTYENAKEEAKKYTTRTDFQYGSPGAYAQAIKNGWIDDYTWFEVLHVSNTYRYNLLEEFISEYEFRTFLENNDQNILLIIIRNLEPKYEPIKKDLEKALARTKETDPIKALKDKYMSDDEEQDANDETENTGEENVHDINTIDMDDDEAFKAVMTEITESSEESEEESEKEEKELSIDDVVKNDETELKVINKIEHMLTPDDRKYIMDKYLHDRRRQWMAEREKKSCNN